MAETTYRMGSVSIDAVVRCYLPGGHVDFHVGNGPIQLPPGWLRAQQVATVTGEIKGTVILPAVEVRLPDGFVVWVNGFALHGWSARIAFSRARARRSASGECLRSGVGP